ncbi:LutC/YkgG family protein [Prevotella sp.]|uniref:LutC/YkgG family protein n=1 Tax=uncultured Prevotella sp. TaxID=159272 RepID=UPI0025F2AB64|nr:LUD domain-containing protein [uncultured Prevotella sp.]
MGNYKEELLQKLRSNTREQYDMPADDIQGITYDDTVAQFIEMSQAVGANVVEAAPGDSLDDIIRKAYPDAKVVASNLPEVKMATLNPDTVADAQALNGTDVGVVRGQIGVAENGCVWIPQSMKQKAVCFICEYLVIVLPQSGIVNNMHEAYARIEMPATGLGTFISGPSKTADIEQALVMGAQAARGVTVVITE